MLADVRESMSLAASLTFDPACKGHHCQPPQWCPLLRTSASVAALGKGGYSVPSRKNTRQWFSGQTQGIHFSIPISLSPLLSSALWKEVLHLHFIGVHTARARLPGAIAANCQDQLGAAGECSILSHSEQAHGSDFSPVHACAGGEQPQEPLHPGFPQYRGVTSGTPDTAPPRFFVSCEAVVSQLQTQYCAAACRAGILRTNFSFASRISESLLGSVSGGC